MRPLSIVLLASGLLMSACASKPSTPPTSQPLTLPAACLADCSPPPVPDGKRMAWEEQMLDWAYDCRKRQSDCAAWVRRRLAGLEQLPDLRDRDAGGDGRSDPRAP